jgi:energy-coupling factor transporter ATP-binding protein EcfA2
VRKAAELLPELANATVILIDGRSGSGKTTLADELVQLLRSQGRGAEVLRVEDLYPGWDGLADGSRAVADVLAAGGYRRYDWELGAFAEWVSLETVPPLVIEGCGAVTRANLDAAAAWAERAGGGIVRSVWIDAPAELRRSRALARDGEMYAPHWKRWAAQEEAFFAYTRPEMLVNFVTELF